MESRFQERPAGHSTFTDIRVHPPFAGGWCEEGGMGGEEGQQLQKLCLQGGKLWRVWGGGGVTTERRAPLSSSVTLLRRGCKTRLLQRACALRFPYTRCWTGTAATTVWFSCRPHLRSPVCVKHTNRPSRYSVSHLRSSEKTHKEVGRIGRSMDMPCPLTQLSHRPHIQPASRGHLQLLPAGNTDGSKAEVVQSVVQLLWQTIPGVVWSVDSGSTLSLLHAHSCFRGRPH